MMASRIVDKLNIYVVDYESARRHRHFLERAVIGLFFSRSVRYTRRRAWQRPVVPFNCNNHRPPVDRAHFLLSLRT